MAPSLSPPGPVNARERDGTTMKIRGKVLLSMAATASLLLSACGSDDHGASAATAAPASAPSESAATRATNAVPSTEGTSVTEPTASTAETTPSTENSGPAELSMVAFSVPKAANEAI